MKNKIANDPGKRSFPGISPFVVPLVLLMFFASSLVLVNEGGTPRFIRFQIASAENGSGEGEKAAEAGKGEGAVEKKAENKEAEAERRRRDAAQARRELEGLEEKRLQIKRQEEKLKAEQMRLRALKVELADKIAELEDMHRKIEESLKKIERKRSEKEVVSREAQDKKIKQLVKMYSTMKPKQAGVIFNSMDIVIAEKILLNMKGDAAGKILAYVEGPRAALISERLAMSVGRSEGRP